MFGRLTGRGAAVMASGTSPCSHPLMLKLCGPRIGAMARITGGGGGNMVLRFASGRISIMTVGARSRPYPQMAEPCWGPSGCEMTHVTTDFCWNMVCRLAGGNGSVMAGLTCSGHDIGMPKSGRRPRCCAMTGIAAGDGRDMIPGFA